MTYKEIHSKLQKLTWDRYELQIKLINAASKSGMEGLSKINYDINNNWLQTMNLLKEMEKLNDRAIE